MSRRNLSTKGLSLSQAQSISNLCYQRAHDISAQLAGVNNASRTFKYGDEILTEIPGKPLPTNVVELLMEQAKLHACQAFLVEHIKLKDTLIQNIQKERFTHNLQAPESPEYKDFQLLPMVDESWAWDQINNADKNEYLEVEAYAAHIGQFIHKNGVLDRLRAELPRIKTLEFIELKVGEKTPVMVTIHHTSEALLAIHNQLAAEHRKYEQKVNYYKAKVKNLVTIENARIAKVNGEEQARVNAENQILREEYQKKHAAFVGEVKQLQHEFEEKRHERIKEIAGLRIEVDARFQEVIDIYLQQVTTE